VRKQNENESPNGIFRRLLKNVKMNWKISLPHITWGILHEFSLERIIPIILSTKFRYWVILFRETHYAPL